jgi:hypothetical protein
LWLTSIRTYCRPSIPQSSRFAQFGHKDSF